MYIIIDNNKIAIKKAKTFFQRLIGLMFKKNFTYGMLFKRCNAIHTFFMKENIDVVALDNQGTIITIARDLEKNQIFNIKNAKKNTNILELPSNTSKSLKIGQRIILYK